MIENENEYTIVGERTPDDDPWHVAIDRDALPRIDDPSIEYHADMDTVEGIRLA